MKAKDLLSQLSRMEHSLHDFSFEELTSKEATQLKSTFETFKKNLENKIFQPSSAATLEDEDEFFENKEFSKNKIKKDPDSNLLIANVSHEIRTPLNGIIGFTDLLKEDAALSEQQMVRVDAIRKASYSLLEIINELLEYSKLSAGLETFDSIPFNFRNLVGDVIYLCKTLVSDKEVSLNVDLDAKIPDVIVGDPSKLTQILLNLLGNAIKFVKKGSIQLIIKSEMQKEKQALLTFSIADTGIGISEENLKHIFDSFKQAETDTYMRYGGSGLGLSIVKQIIERLGGDISATSELGVGTTFKFSIPFEVSNTASPMNSDNISSQVSEKEKDAVEGMRILVFEDNTMNQKLIDQRLKTWGCKRFITENAQYGLSILANHKIDLILMDLKMPGMTGFEVAEIIRNSEEAAIKSIPIIALSADFSVRDKEECSKNGFDDFILKPFSSDELLQKLIDNKRDATTTIIDISHAVMSSKVQTEHSKIDLSGILEECLGDFNMLEELIVLYKQNTLEFIGNIRIHLKNSDREQIGFAAHKIKSGLKMMQSEGLYGIIEQIQKSCVSGADMKNLKFLYDSFLVEYPKAEMAIDKAMDELRKQEK